MDAARWVQLSPLLDELLELDSARRQARLAQLGASDAELAAELRELLALEGEERTFLDGPLLGVPDSKPPPVREGMRIGQYRLIRMLGEGGMGQVWLAERHDGLYRRGIALKLLRPGIAEPALLQRFARERDVLARLQHPNIADLLDAGVSDEGQPYLALAYVEGLPITEHCHERRLTVRPKLKLFLQVCAAVSHAHANLVVHRDLKPSNIMVTSLGQIRLLDFGIAQLLEESEAELQHQEMRAFTLHYAAPELVRGETVGTAADVYSLGVVLYELLTGKKPYRLRRQVDADWERVILSVEPLPPSEAVMRDVAQAPGGPTRAHRLAQRLRGDLDAILLKSLQKDPAQRYGSVEALSRDIERHLDGRPVLARPRQATYRASRYLKRHRWALAGAAGVVLTLAGALTATLWQAHQARQQAARAQAMQNFVVGLLEQAGSGQRGNAFDIRQLLDAGERRGDVELADQPREHAELMGVLARLWIGMGDYRRGLALLQRQQAVMTLMGEVPPELQLGAASLRGRALQLMSRSGDCLKVALPQVPLAIAEQARLTLEAATLFTQVGRCERMLGHRQAARQWSERALALNRYALGNAAGVAENMADLAAMESEVGNVAAAIAGYQRALNYLEAQMGADQPQSVGLLRQLGAAFRTRGEADQAEHVLRRALAMSTRFYGADHPETLAVQRQLALALIGLGQLNEASTLLRREHAMTLRQLGPSHRDTGYSWDALGVLAIERGDGGEAVDDLARTVAIWRHVDGGALLPRGLFDYGRALALQGRDDEAIAALEEARRLRVDVLGASHPAVAETNRAIADVLSRQGDHAAAARLLSQALQLAQLGYGENDPRTFQIELSRAMNFAREGKSAAALQVFDAIAAQPAANAAARRVRWIARLQAAAQRCNRDPAARRRLLALDGDLQQAFPDGGSLVRDARALREACQSGQAPSLQALL